MPGFTTTIVHSDRRGGIEHGSLHRPIHTSVAYGYEDVQDLADVFQGRSSAYSYGRQVNPTVSALETKINAMERGVATVCFGTGMAAIGMVLFALLRKGDHFVSSSFLFGNTNSLFQTFGLHGIDVTFVDATSTAAVAEAIRPDTRLVFVETIANPRTQVADLEGIGEFCRATGLVYVVDNTMTSPYLFQPVDVGASLIVNSLTKYIGGHGTTLGGALTETGRFDWSTFPNIQDTYKKGDPAKWAITQVRKKGLRDFGPTLGPQAALHLGIGAETLALRQERQCANARALVEFLNGHEKVARVYYPGLSDHPEHARAMQAVPPSRGLVQLRACQRTRRICVPESTRRGHQVQQPRRQPHARDSRGRNDLLRDGAGTPRQHGDRRFADPDLHRHRGHRRPAGRLRAGARRGMTSGLKRNTWP